MVRKSWLDYSISQHWTLEQGQNLILNMNDKGFNVVAYNRTTEKIDHFLANEAKGEFNSSSSLASFVSFLGL